MDSFSHFAAVNFPVTQTDRHTDTQTERCDKQEIYSNSAYAQLIVSDALKISRPKTVNACL